jgi:hypothetical protein
LLSWATPQDRAYDQVVRLAWNFIENKVPVESNGLRVYLVHSTFDPVTLRGTDWPHNPASYMGREDGEVTGAMAVSDLWFSDSYGDYIQHFLAGMASAPEWSPPGENHLLSSSSVVVKVSYGPGELRYNTFDQDATELLRLAFHPAQVTANGTPLRPRDDLNGPDWVFNPRTGVLQVRHAKARDIIISGEGSS